MKIYSVVRLAGSRAEAKRTHLGLTCFATATALLALPAALSLGVSALPDSGDDVVLSPTQHLFRGELVRIWPHIGWIAAGCVEVEPADRPSRVRINCQVWENGVKEKDVRGPEVVMKRVRPKQDHEPNQKWEASISLKPVAASDEGNPRVEVRMVLQDGYTIATHEPIVVVMPRAHGATGTTLIKESVSARPSKTYPVWQYVILPNLSSGLRTDPGEGLDECAWGIVMGIEVEDGG
jgi:hypothetical protein